MHFYNGIRSSQFEIRWIIYILLLGINVGSIYNRIYDVNVFTIYKNLNNMVLYIRLYTQILIFDPEIFI